MGTDDLYKKRRQNRTRKVGTRATRDRILIVCEGTKTEPNYFEGFRLTNVQIVGTGSNTHSVVKRALEEKRRAKRNKARFGVSSIETHFHPRILIMPSLLLSKMTYVLLIPMNHLSCGISYIFIIMILP